MSDDATAEGEQKPADQKPEDQKGDEQKPEQKPDREAAKYRTQLRETESDRDAIRDRLDRLQRTEAARIAADGNRGLLNGEDLFAIGGVELDAIRNDDGDLDPTKIAAAAEDLRKERPYLGKQPKKDYGAGHRDGAPTGSQGETKTSWQEAIASSRRD